MFFRFFGRKIEMLEIFGRKLKQDKLKIS
jgi:hypothetical protein